MNRPTLLSSLPRLNELEQLLELVYQEYPTGRVVKRKPGLESARPRQYIFDQLQTLRSRCFPSRIAFQDAWTDYD